MLYSRGTVHTFDSITFTFETIKQVCEESGAKIRSVDERNYRLYGKSRILSRSVISYNFYVILEKKADGVLIEIYDGMPIMRNPDRKFLEPILLELARRISFKTAYRIDMADREMTNDGWIITTEDNPTIWDLIDPEIFKNNQYEIEVVDYKILDENIQSIRKLDIILNKPRFEIQLRKNNKTEPIVTIPFMNIEEIKTIPTKRKSRFGTNSIVALSLTYKKIGTTKDEDSRIDNPTELSKLERIFFYNNYIMYNLNILEHLRLLKEIDRDEKIRIRLLALYLGVVICTICYKDNSSFLFSDSQVCTSCFKRLYGEIVLHVKNGEYYGGHKFHLAGGQIGDHEIGELYLTKNFLIFIKYDKNPSSSWDIRISLESVILGQWKIQEESRRTTFSALSADQDISLMGGLLMESGKRHRLVVPYIDEKGIQHSPVFGISSFGGKAIKDWAKQLYQMIIENIETIPNSDETTDADRDIHHDLETTPKKIVDKNQDPISILRLRFAKGEINKQEYEEMKKLLDQN